MCSDYEKGSILPYVDMGENVTVEKFRLFCAP